MSSVESILPMFGRERRRLPGQRRCPSAACPATIAAARPRPTGGKRITSQRVAQRGRGRHRLHADVVVGELRAGRGPSATSPRSACSASCAGGPRAARAADASSPPARAARAWMLRPSSDAARPASAALDAADEERAARELRPRRLERLLRRLEGRVLEAIAERDQRDVGVVVHGQDGPGARHARTAPRPRPSRVSTRRRPAPRDRRRAPPATPNSSPNVQPVSS